MDYEQFMLQWEKQIKSMVDLTPKEQARVTKAGADVLKEEYAKAVKQKRHVSKKPDPKWGHLAETVESSNKNADNKIDGTSTVGWGDSLNAAKARWLNDGTIHIRGDHWLTNTRDSQRVQHKVFKAEEREYKRLVKHKQKGAD